ncbi:hypothetical protein KM043_000453 [Ampulex compressa]|nr:hypothetical protein KM043_000453 [Ampulex compressa]
MPRITVEERRPRISERHRDRHRGREGEGMPVEKAKASVDLSIPRSLSTSRSAGRPSERDWPTGRRESPRKRVRRRGASRGRPGAASSSTAITGRNSSSARPAPSALPPPCLRSGPALSQRPKEASALRAARELRSLSAQRPQLPPDKETRERRARQAGSARGAGGARRGPGMAARKRNAAADPRVRAEAASRCSREEPSKGDKAAAIRIQGRARAQRSARRRSAALERPNRVDPIAAASPSSGALRGKRVGAPPASALWPAGRGEGAARRPRGFESPDVARGFTSNGSTRLKDARPNDDPGLPAALALLLTRVWRTRDRYVALRRYARRGEARRRLIAIPVLAPNPRREDRLPRLAAWPERACRAHSRATASRDPYPRAPSGDRRPSPLAGPEEARLPIIANPAAATRDPSSGLNARSSRSLRPRAARRGERNASLRQRGGREEEGHERKKLGRGSGGSSRGGESSSEPGARLSSRESLNSTLYTFYIAFDYANRWLRAARESEQLLPSADEKPSIGGDGFEESRGFSTAQLPGRSRPRPRSARAENVQTREDALARVVFSPLGPGGAPSLGISSKEF